MRDPIISLLRAAGEGNTISIKELLRADLSINAANHVGGTALMAACASYRVETVKYLLDAGADVNLRTRHGRTALHAAVGSTPSLPERQRDCVRLLLQHFAPVNVQDAAGVSPLMNAVWFGCSLAVLELLSARVALDLRDSEGRTAKDLGVLRERHEILKAIAEAEKRIQTINELKSWL